MSGAMLTALLDARIYTGRVQLDGHAVLIGDGRILEIGRASCRERV